MIIGMLAQQLFRFPLHAIIVEALPDAIGTVTQRLTEIDRKYNVRAKVPELNLVSFPAISARDISSIAGMEGVANVYEDTQRNIIQLPPMEWEAANWWATGASRNLLGAEQAFKEGFTGENVTLGIIDTGVDPTNPQLIGAAWASEIRVPFYEPGLDAGPQASGHGSHCASTAAGKLVHTEVGQFVEGVSHAQLFCVQALGRVIGMGFKSEIISAILKAWDSGARVFSMSLGSESIEGDGQTDPEARVIRDLTNQGAIFVIAAGNSGPGADTINSPGVVNEAITVGAIGRDGEIASFSSRGSSWRKPDVVAPGVDIYSGTGRGSQIDNGDPEAGHSYAAISGTSMATPHVAGLVCLLRQKHPGITASQFKATLREKAGRDWSPDYGWGVPHWNMFA